MYGDEHLYPIMLVSAGTTFLGGVANPKLVVFSRSLIFYQDFALGASQKIVGFVVGVMVAILWRNYWALVAATVASEAWRIALSFVFIPYWPKLTLRRARELIGFSVWVTLGEAVSALNWKLDYLLVGYFLGNDVRRQLGPPADAGARSVRSSRDWKACPVRFLDHLNRPSAESDQAGHAFR